MNNLDPEQLIKTGHCYIKHSNRLVHVGEWKYQKKENRVLVKINFDMGYLPEKSDYEMCEEISAIRIVSSVNMDGSFFDRGYPVYEGWFDIKNLSDVPFGSPAAALIYK